MTEFTNKFWFSYICHGCGEHKVCCRYREEGENIVKWVQGPVSTAMSKDHVKRNCTHTKCDLKLPANQIGDLIGMRPQSATIQKK